MRIIWNNEVFQAELTPGEQWRTDMEAVKAAGFRCSGPPSWQWYTSKASALNKLREHRPPSGLTLTEVALKQYNSRNEQEQKKAEVKKQFATASKKAKKLSKDPSISGTSELVIPEGKHWVSAEDLPAWAPLRKESERKHLTETLGRCIICDEWLYIYESSTACLFCEKMKCLCEEDCAP